MKVCSFTGHREIKRSHKKLLPDMLYRAVNYAYGEGCREFCVGGALGFDTEAAKAVIKYRMSHPDVVLHVIAPCADQSSGWSKSDRDFYDYTLGAADTVTVLAEHYYNGCMRARNLALAERCDIMIAYLYKDGSGACQTVRMAEGAGKTVYNIYPSIERTVRNDL